MPVYWEGNTVVGTSGGTDTSGNPINPTGKVEGQNYGTGGSGSGSGGSTDTPEQQAAKRRMLESPTAQWASQEAYQAAYSSYISGGGTPFQQPETVNVPSASLEVRKSEAAWITATTPQAQVQAARPDPYAGREFIPGAEWLATQRQQAQSQNIHRNAPVTAGLYEQSASLTNEMQSAVGGAIGYSPTAHPGIKVLFGASSLITGLPQMVGMAAVVSEFAVRNPARVPESVVGGLPMMAAELTKQVQTSPFETAGVVAGMIIAPRVGKIVSEQVPGMKIRALEPIKISKTETFAPGEVGPGIGDFWKGKTPSLGIEISKPHVITPASSAVALGLVPAATAGNVYQGLSIEQGRKAQPVIGITDQDVTNLASLKLGDKTIVAGTPRFKPEAVPEIYKSQFMSESGYRDFSNPTEFNIAMKNILPTYDPTIRALVEGSMAKRQLTYGVKSTHQLSDVPLEDVFTRHELGMATQKNLRTYMQQQQDFIIWGSTANKAQVMGKGGVGYFREIHDIDIHVRDPALTTKELLAVISKTEKPGKVSMKAGGLVTERGHLFDIKNIEGGMPEEIGISTSEISKKRNVFLFPEEKPVKIGKFTTQSLSSQATSKLSSIGLREQTVSAAPHRAGKDPFDLAFINEPSLTKDLARSLNPFKRMRAGKAERLDLKIQELTESKIRTQTIGDMPGDITAQQKKLFFDNLRALRSGQPVIAAPQREMLYTGPARSQPKLPANILRAAGGISAPSPQPHIRHEGVSYPGQPRIPSQTYDQGSISRQIHQVISNQKMMFSPPRSSRSGEVSVRMPRYSGGVPSSRSGYRVPSPSGSGHSIPVYPRSSGTPPSISGHSITPPGYRGGGITISPPPGYRGGGITISPPPGYRGGGGMLDQFKPPPMFKFDDMGDVRPRKGRKASAYEIINPFSKLKDLVRGL